MLIYIAYIILAMIVGVYGRNRSFGFLGFFLLSLLLTPVVVFLFLFITKQKAAPTN